jgi:murein tripeptide amidase MpaA
MYVVWLSSAGESQAEWFIEGLLERLTNPSDSIARHLLRDAVIYVMPNVCPDGTW